MTACAYPVDSPRSLAYIVLVNPSILCDAGMPVRGVFAATCVAAALGTILMRAKRGTPSPKTVPNWEYTQTRVRPTGAWACVCAVSDAMARLTTHVLDTGRGLPAAEVRIELHRCGVEGRVSVTTAWTNADGRTDAPLLAGADVVAGVYELTFHVGEYLQRMGVELASPPFLDQVVVRFGLADANVNYHVPLLLSPYGYSTYRGS